MTGTLDAVERTSLLTAALRAAETRREDRLYTDPYADRLAGAGWQMLGRLHEVTSAPGRTAPSTPDFNAIRTRFFDDFLHESVQDPAMRQVVLAPAGMDSRAYRTQWPADLRWFEVDRPAVLAHKASVLAEDAPRVDRRTAAVDLAAPDWEDTLLAAGYDPALPSTWLVEGLLYYLREEDVHGLLDRIAALSAPGSRIAADLVNAAALTLPDMQDLLEVFADWGCPWIFGTDEPEELFAKHGFTVTATQPGEPPTDYGRWPDPVPPREQAGVRRVFFAHGGCRP